MKKGLRPPQKGLTYYHAAICWKKRPDEEGIATPHGQEQQNPRPLVGRRDLMKKGLRRFVDELQISITNGWKKRPDEEGIETRLAQ